jgi:hypothetical protein
MKVVMVYVLAKDQEHVPGRRQDLVRCGVHPGGHVLHRGVPGQRRCGAQRSTHARECRIPRRSRGSGTCRTAIG